jgi:arginyl-tRNA synthetase
MNLLFELRQRFAAALTGLCDDPAQWALLVKPAQDERFGDYQANCAMPLAKQRATDPRKLAAEIVARLDLEELCEPAEVAGPGFINLRLRASFLAELANRQAADSRLGVANQPPRRIVVDYSGPNVAKPMHVGHLRSTVIGDALCRILRYLGHTVTGDNHIGDWGTQFGMIIVGYKHFLDQEAWQIDQVGELARLYRLVNSLSEYHEAREGLAELEVQTVQARDRLEACRREPPPTEKKELEARRKAEKRLAEALRDAELNLAQTRKLISDVEASALLGPLARAHPQIAVQSRAETARLHAGDATSLALWKQFMPACLASLDQMYERMGIRFDVTLGESFYQPFLAATVEDLLSRGIARFSDGAVCVFIEGVEAPFIVRKSDGAYTYATTDLATIRYRATEFGAATMLYVVDARQSDHFRLLFDTARLWGYGATEFRHVSFGTILGDDKRPFKTRSGGTVGLESLLDEAVARAGQIVAQNDDAKPQGPELDAAARAEIAEAVGIGAIKYADLAQNRETDYIFSFDKMLATTGDTATYMQYAYARVCGIFRKGQVDREAVRDSVDPIVLSEPAERALAAQLARFSEAVEQAAAECRPNYLTAYLFETANRFSTFFEGCPVLKAETHEIRNSRLKLADLTARIISRGLDLLGIRTIEQM